ncbi:hypothetical protein B8W95_13295, partial [Staphylococcus pasteuri]
GDISEEGRGEEEPDSAVAEADVAQVEDQDWCESAESARHKLSWVRAGGYMEEQEEPTRPCG